MMVLVTLAILRAPDSHASYQAIAENMIDIEPEQDWKAIIRKHFDIRGVFAPDDRLLLGETVELDLEGTCSTIRERDTLNFAN